MILIVEAESKNRELLQKALEQTGRAVMAVANEDEAHGVNPEKAGIRVAVIDLAGLSPKVWNLCRSLKAQSIACLVIMPRENREARTTAMASGAHAVLVKPLAMREFLGIVGSLADSP